MDGGDPIIIEDLEGNIIDVNDEAVASYGWKREALLGTPAISLIPRGSQKQVKKILDQCKKGKAMRNIEGLRCHKSGESIPVLCTFSLLSGKTGDPVAIATIARNYPPIKMT